MFNLDEAVSNWRAEMIRAGIKRGEVLAELEGHLREHYRRLIAIGVSPEEAFASATQQLVTAKLLKQEFSKVGSHGWASWRNNPATLNILGLWFIVAGLNGAAVLLPVLWELARSGLNWSLPAVSASGTIMLSRWTAIFEVGCLLILSSQVLIGWGLLYRWNFARTCALGWARTSLLLFAISEIYLNTHHAYSGPPANSLGLTTMTGTIANPHFIFLGMTLPMVSLQIISLLNVGLLVWACYLLTRPAIRNRFRAGKNYV